MLIAGSSFENGNPDPRKGTLFTAFLSNVKVVSSETLLPSLVARAMLNGRISREFKGLRSVLTVSYSADPSYGQP